MAKIRVQLDDKELTFIHEALNYYGVKDYTLSAKIAKALASLNVKVAFNIDDKRNKPLDYFTGDNEENNTNTNNSLPISHVELARINQKFLNDEDLTPEENQIYLKSIGAI